MAQKLYSTPQAAEILSCSEILLRKWRMTGNGPRFVRVGNKMVRYTSQDLEDFIESLARLESTSCTGGADQ